MAQVTTDSAPQLHRSRWSYNASRRVHRCLGRDQVGQLGAFFLGVPNYPNFVVDKCGQLEPTEKWSDIWLVSVGHGWVWNCSSLGMTDQQTRGLFDRVPNSKGVTMSLCPFHPHGSILKDQDTRKICFWTVCEHGQIQSLTYIYTHMYDVK